MLYNVYIICILHIVKLIYDIDDQWPLVTVTIYDQLAAFSTIEQYDLYTIIVDYSWSIF